MIAVTHRATLAGSLLPQTRLTLSETAALDVAGHTTRDHPASQGNTPVVTAMTPPRAILPFGAILGLLLGLLAPTAATASGSPNVTTAATADSRVAEFVDARVSPSTIVLAKPGTRTSPVRVRGTVVGGDSSTGQIVDRVRVQVVGTKRSAVHRLPAAVCLTCDRQRARFDLRARVGRGKQLVRVQALARNGRVLASQTWTVRLAVPAVRVTPSRLGPGGTRAARIRVRSGGVMARAVVTVRAASGTTVWSRSLPPSKRWTARWAGVAQSGAKVGPGRYRVTVRVTPVAEHGGHTSVAVSRTVRVRRSGGTAGQARLTRYGYLQPVPVARSAGTFHLEVHQRKNQLLVVGRNNSVVRRIPITGNLSVAKPSFSRVQHRTALTYDFGYQWRLPWFVNLIAGRSIGSHAIPRHVTDGHPIMAVPQLGRSWPNTPVSAGCLRMHSVNARWVYDNVPNGTPVYWLS